jgi:O-antigen/teichoic acid export membrane protein
MNTQTSTFKQRVLKAGMWTFGGHLVSQIIRLGSNLVMTRLLAPEMFGVMSIVVLIMIGVSLLTDIGLVPNVIRNNKSDDPLFMDAIWTIQVIKGLLMWFLMLLLSLGLQYFISNGYMPINTVYANPILPILIPVLCFVLVINGLEQTWTMLATKEMKQAILTKIELISQLCSVLVMIVWAYFNQSVWALIAGAISAALAKCILTYYFRKGRLNRWNYDPIVVKDVLNFGKWIIISSVFGFCTNNGDRLILGGLVDEKVLGLYSIAFLFVSAISAVDGKILTSVVYPAFCEAQKEGVEKLKKTYYKFRFISDIAIFFATGFLFAIGHSLVDLLYDNRYQQAGEILQIISVGLIGIRYNVSEQYFVALSKPHMMTYSIIIKTTALFLLVPFAFHYFGFIAALWAIVISGCASFPLSLYYKYKLGILSIKNEFMTMPTLILGWLLGVLATQILNIFTK